MRVGVIMQEPRNWNQNWVVEACDGFRGTEQLRNICFYERTEEQDFEEKGKSKPR